MARPHIEPYVELNDPFKKFDIAGFKGSSYKVLSLDTDTGACTLKVRFDGGYRRKPGLSYSDDDLQSGVGGGSLQSGLESVLSFLGACVESGADGDNTELFPANVREWAEQFSDEISMLACELEERELITA